MLNLQSHADKDCSFFQYTDAGVYTCSEGGREHKIPGSYGMTIQLRYIQPVPVFKLHALLAHYRHIGHYEQDAQTYATWGVECKGVSYLLKLAVLMLTVLLQMSRWTGAILRSMEHS